MSKLKMMLLGLLAIVLVVVTATGVTYVLMSKQPINIALGQSKTEAKGKEFGPIQDVGEFTVNLSGDSFLKTQVSLELTDKKYSENIVTNLAVVKDKIIGVLSTKSLNDIKSPNGKENLRKQLLSEINGALGTSEINNILFTSYVYQ